MIARRLLTRPSPHARPRREGAAAIEFGIVALPFFFVIFAIMELGIVFLIDSLMENAVQRASRLVRTGQAQEAGFTAGQFKDAFCSRMSVFEGDCQNRATVDVREIPQFRDPNPPDPIVEGVMDDSRTTFDPADAGDLVMVRVWYAQPVATPMLSQALSRLQSGAAVIQVTTAFRNEPFNG